MFRTQIPIIRFVLTLLASLWIWMPRVAFAQSPPSFTMDPNDLTLVVGTTLQENVAVAGTPPISVKWWHNGQSIVVGTNRLYSRPKCVPADSGQYWATAANAFGIVTSRVATVQVFAAPVITVQPVSQSVLPTDTPRFSVVSIGYGTSAYQWYKDGVVIPDKTSQILDVTNPLDSIGVYSVDVANLFGVTRSSNAILSLARPPTATEKAPYIISVQGPTTPVYEGSRTIMSATAGGQSPFIYQWFLNGVLVQGATNQSYSIDFIATNQAGLYSLAVTNAYGSSWREGPTVSVIPRPANDNFVDRAPLVISSSFRTGQADTINATSEPGDPVIVAGAGGKSVWWSWAAPVSGIATVDTAGSAFYTMLGIYIGDSMSSLEPVAQGFSINGPGATAFSFQVHSNDVYQIMVDSYYRIAGIAAVTISVVPDTNISAAPLITSQPFTNLSTAGRSLQLPLTAVGAAPLHVEWYRDGKLVSASNVLGYTNNDAQAGDAGIYVAWITNRYGSTRSAPIQVGVLPAAISLINPLHDVGVTEGNKLSVEVVVAGSEPISCVWTKDGTLIPGATNRALVYTNATRDMSGIYSVAISNGLGSTNAGPVSVFVVPAPIRYAWSTLAGLHNQSGTNDGWNDAASFKEPSGICLGVDGQLLVADGGSGLIRHVTTNGYVTTLAGGFNYPVDVVEALDGSVFVQQEGVGATYRLLDNGARSFFGGGDWGLAIDDQENLLQISVNGSIRELSHDGTISNLIVASFSPVAAHWAPDGSLIIADTYGPVIRRWTRGDGLSVIGGALNASGVNDGPALSFAQMRHPNSISLDPDGNVFFADEFASSIRRLSKDGLVSTLGQFADGIVYARRVVVAPDGALYVVNTGDDTIKKGVPYVAPEYFRATLLDSEIQLTWPVEAKDFLLETSSSLAAGANWVVVGNGIAESVNGFAYGEAVGSEARFFRLRHR